MFELPKSESSAGPCLARPNLHKHPLFPNGWAYVRDGPVKIPKVTCEIVGPQRICAHQPLGDS